MAQKRKKTKRSPQRSHSSKPTPSPSRSGKKTGRPREINIEDLPNRYRKAKSFLEHHWGLFSIDLKRVEDPTDVPGIFKRVRGVEWMVPFRETENARCLLFDKTLDASSKEIRDLRKKCDHAKKEEERLWFDYNNTHPKARDATDALARAISNFQDALGTFPFFAVISILANQLRVERLNQLASQLVKAARDAQQVKVQLEEKLRAQEADSARKELVRFVNQNDRADRTVINFARVIAGLPEWRWLHSIRECKKLRLGPSKPEYAYQLFQRLKIIIRGMKPPKAKNIERRLRGELLSTNCDPMLRGYADPHWHDLRDAIYSCRDVKKQELPDRIMEKFLQNLQTPKDSVDRELAKHNQLVLQS